MQENIRDKEQQQLEEEEERQAIKSIPLMIIVVSSRMPVTSLAVSGPISMKKRFV
jgi:hypothetical protein